jgi:uncharacterized membrane protein
MVITAALVIGGLLGAALGRVIGNRTGAVVGAVISAAACLAYANLLDAAVLKPTVTVISTMTVVAAVLCGLRGGLFYAFSTAVMTAFSRQPHPSGMSTMQTLNVVVFNPWFGGAFSLAPVACALAMLTALVRWPAPDAPWVTAGGALFLTGTLSVTALCNVPRNDALVATPADAQGASEVWARFLREWTFWNHVRTGAALLAAALLTSALLSV